MTGTDARARCDARHAAERRPRVARGVGRREHLDDVVPGTTELRGRHGVGAAGGGVGADRDATPTRRARDGVEARVGVAHGIRRRRHRRGRLQGLRLGEPAELAGEAGRGRARRPRRCAEPRREVVAGTGRVVPVVRARVVGLPDGEVVEGARRRVGELVEGRSDESHRRLARAALVGQCDRGRPQGRREAPCRRSSPTRRPSRSPRRCSRTRSRACRSARTRRASRGRIPWRRGRAPPRSTGRPRHGPAATMASASSTRCRRRPRRHPTRSTHALPLEG